MKSFVLLYIVIGIIALALEVAVASKFEDIAKEKGYSGYFWWCFWFNIIGFIMVAALPDKKGMEETRRQFVSAVENENKSKGQQPQPQNQPQQTYWNNSLPPL